MRGGARLAIGEMPGFAICGETGTSVGAPEAAAAASADIIVLDLFLGTKGDGLPLVTAIRQGLPAAKILVFTMNAEELFGNRAIAAGANGYLVKGGELSELQEAIRQVSAGQTYRRHGLAAEGDGAAEAPTVNAALAELSDREMQVFLLLGAGKSTQQIADDLGVSIKTASAHRENLKAKLGVSSAPELIRRAVAYVVGHGNNPP